MNTFLHSFTVFIHISGKCINFVILLILVRSVQKEKGKNKSKHELKKCIEVSQIPEFLFLIQVF